VTAMRHGQQGTAAFRAIVLPRAVHVEVDVSARPVAVTRAPSRGHTGVRAQVTRIEDVWRVGEAWWRAGAQMRTYYRVILDGDRPLTLFRDDAIGAWFEQPYSAPDREAPR
jgi:hypothetical protein